MTIVLDASAALAWVFPRARDEEAQAAKALLGRLEEEEALAPSIWHLEVTNALVTARRRAAITDAKALDFLSRLDALAIQTPGASADRSKPRLFLLAGQYDLSAYDAAYLDLALETGASLATFDAKLAAARDRAGVPAA